MTKEELKQHCERQVEECEKWAKYKGTEPSGKIYEEHKLILDLIKALEQQPSDESIKYLECNNIDVQKFTEALKMQPLQIIKPNISDDCVSRQAILDGVKSMSNANPSYWITCDVVDREDLIDGIQSLPPITPTQSWIPVSERLPEDRNIVLVTAYWHETYQVMMASYFGEGLWWCVPFNNCGDHMQKLNPKAWQPLPKPYEEKRGNESEIN